MFTKRQYKDGLFLWARFMMKQREKENGSEFILLKMRKLLIAQYFLKYKNTVLFIKRTKHQLKRSENLEDLFKKRLIIKIYRNWIEFIEMFKQQQTCLKKMFTRLLRTKMKR